MKKSLFLFVLFVSFITIQAQNYSFNYQAVIRNTSGDLLPNQQIGVRIDIHVDQAEGSVVFSEKHSVQSSQNAVINLHVGEGTSISGALNELLWGSHSYFLEILIDSDGGENFSSIGNTQMLYVPLAAYANKSATSTEADYATSAGTAQTADYTTLTNKPDFTGWDTDAANDFDGDYTKLTNKPDFTGWDTDASDDFSGNYADLNGKPTKLSEFTNDPAFISSESQNLEDVLTQSNSANGTTITDLPTPSVSSDAATKAYVDLLEAKIDQLETRLYEGGSMKVTDYEGNEYRTVKIGEQIWMAENLRSKYYSDGTALLDGTSINTTGSDVKYFFYPETEADAPIYGLLYNWFAVMGSASQSDASPSGVQGICPDGWHVPSDTEIREMEMYLGISEAVSYDIGERGTTQGQKMKQKGDAYWNTGNTGTDELGFRAIPAGYRGEGTNFLTKGSNFYMWSTTILNTDPFYRGLSYSANTINRGEFSDRVGFSVRCIKN